MSQVRDLRTLGYVLRRTNYGEADRILNIITPKGKVTAIAKGVRREKSKLAGGIELFSKIDFNIHFGKSELGILTGVKMQKHFGNIVKDYEKMELAALILKKINQAAESSDNPEFFKIVDECLENLNFENKNKIVETWFLLNLRKAMGSELNLYRDVNGDKLVAGVKYNWRADEEAFYEDEYGRFGADEIKMLRLMTTNDLGLAMRVKIDDEMMNEILRFVQMVL